MQARIYNWRKSASIFMEYAMVIAVVSLAIVTMNIYMKRGMQGRLKEMTDYFISNEQLVEIDPVTSDSNTTTDTTTVEDTNIGGGTMLALLDRSETNSTSTLIDESSPYSSPFVVADRGFITVPDRPDEEDYTTDNPNEDHIDWETQTSIRTLEIERDRLRTEADMLDSQAPNIQQRGQGLLDKIKTIIGQRWVFIPVTYLNLLRITRNRAEARAIYALAAPRAVGCQQYQCAEAAVKLYRNGNNLLRQARDMRNRARALRAEADRIQDRIDELEEPDE